MNDDRQLRLLRERHLVAEDAVLHFARRMIVEVVETDLAPRDDFRMFHQPGQFIQMLLRDYLRFVRMDPHRGVNPIVLLREGQRRIEFLRAGARADREQCGDTCCPCAFEHGFAVFRELREVDVRV